MPKGGWKGNPTIPEVRIADEYISILKELSEILHSSRSEVIRRAMEEGIKDIRMKIAMEKYLDEKFSLCRAAEFADVSMRLFIFF